MDKSELLHITYASDAGYLPYLAVAAGSAFLRASDASRTQWKEIVRCLKR